MEDQGLMSWEVSNCEAVPRVSPLLFRKRRRAPSSSGAVIENLHGLHWNTFRSEANANHMASFIICPQIAQVTSMGVASVRIFNALESSFDPRQRNYAMLHIFKAHHKHPPLLVLDNADPLTEATDRYSHFADSGVSTSAGRTR